MLLNYIIYETNVLMMMIIIINIITIIIIIVTIIIYNIIIIISGISVSYTHLDVYKRQHLKLHK